MYLFLILSCVLTVGAIAKETFEKEPSKRCLTDSYAYMNDVLNGVSHEDRMKNMYNGKYIKDNHVKPRRYKDGSILVENTDLFQKDIDRYGTAQAYRFAREGKYNL